MTTRTVHLLLSSPSTEYDRKKASPTSAEECGEENWKKEKARMGCKAFTA